MRTATCVLVVALLLSGSTAPLFAQGPWSVALGGGAAGFGGASTSADGSDGSFKPSPTTRLHLGLARSFGRGAIGMDASYAKAGLGAYIPGYSYSGSPGMTLYDIRLLAGYRLLKFGSSSSLSAALGPMLQVWTGDAIIDVQSRVGGAMALILSVPISSRVGLLVTGSLGVAGSPFDADILSSQGEYEPVAIWTRELMVGVRLSL